MRNVWIRASLPCGTAALGWTIWLLAVKPATDVNEAYAGVMAGVAGAVLLVLALYPTSTDADRGARWLALILRGVAAGLTGLSLLTGITATLPAAQHVPHLIASLSSAATASLGAAVGLVVGSLLGEAIDIVT